MEDNKTSEEQPMRDMPEIEKDLQYFLEEVANKCYYSHWSLFEKSQKYINNHLLYDLMAKDRFHAYQIEQLKEQLAQKDKEIELFRFSITSLCKQANMHNATIERLTKELREEKLKTK